MSIQLKLTWKDGKTWDYKSDRVVHEEEAPPQLLTANSIVASPPPHPTPPHPQKRHVTVPNSKHLEDVNSDECRICRETGGKSFWIGCSCKNKLSGRQDCNYRVHQWCIGLYYKKPENLAKVPYFCLTHGQKKQKGKQKKPISFNLFFSMFIANRIYGKTSLYIVQVHCTYLVIGN